MNFLFFIFASNAEPKKEKEKEKSNIQSSAVGYHIEMPAKRSTASAKTTIHLLPSDPVVGHFPCFLHTCLN